MKKFIFALMLVTSWGCAESAPTQDNFDKDEVLRMFRVIKAYQTEIDTDTEGEWSPLDDLLEEHKRLFAWSEHRKLTSKERVEIFENRLSNYPDLLAEAEEYLDRDVSEEGFGFVFSETSQIKVEHTQEELAQASELFDAHLASFGLKRFEARK